MAEKADARDRNSREHGGLQDAETNGQTQERAAGGATAGSSGPCAESEGRAAAPRWRALWRDLSGDPARKRPRCLDRDSFSARARRAIALASRRRSRDLALACRRPAQARNRRRIERGNHPAWCRCSCRRNSASDRAGARLAGGREPGRMDPCWLYGCTRFFIRGLRTGRTGLVATPMT